MLLPGIPAVQQQSQHPTTADSNPLDLYVSCLR
jgi:hypothetical protein